MNDPWYLEERMRRLLDRDERLLWKGLASRRLDREWFKMIAAVAWCSLMFWKWKFALLGDDSTRAVVIASLLAFVVLLWLNAVITWPLYDAYRRRKTLYGITDRRVVIVSGDTYADSISLGSIIDIKFKERSGGGGVITFKTSCSVSLWKYFYEGFEERQPVFVLNTAVRDVAKIVRCAQSRSVDPVADV